MKRNKALTDIQFDKHRCPKGEEGGTSCSPSKDFKKLDHKNAIKHKNRGPPPIFSHNSSHNNNLKMTMFYSHKK